MVTRERFGSLAIVVLAAFLILHGAAILIGVAIPEWVEALLSLAAGILLLVGR